MRNRKLFFGLLATIIIIVTGVTIHIILNNSQLELNGRDKIEISEDREMENQQSDFIILKIPIVEYKVPGNILSEPIIKGYSQKIIRKNDEFIIDPATLGYDMEHSVGDIKLRLVDILQDSIIVDVLANEQFDGTFYPLDEIERRSIKNGGCIGAFPLVMDVYYEYCFELGKSDSQMTLKYKIEGESTMPLP